VRHQIVHIGIGHEAEAVEFVEETIDDSTNEEILQLIKLVAAVGVVQFDKFFSLLTLTKSCVELSHLLISLKFALGDVKDVFGC
jgi:hypothetical protein